MTITAKECRLTFSDEEYALINNALDLYQSAVASDFTADPAFDRLVFETSIALGDYELSPDEPFPAIQIAVLWDALNHWYDNNPTNPARPVARALFLALAPYADFETDAAAYFAARERKR